MNKMGVKERVGAEGVQGTCAGGDGVGGGIDSSIKCFTGILFDSELVVKRD